MRLTCDRFVRKCTPDPCGASKNATIRQKHTLEMQPFRQYMPSGLPSTIGKYMDNVPACSTSMQNALTSNPPTLGRSVRPLMGERFTSPLPLSASGSDPTCCKMYDKLIRFSKISVLLDREGVSLRAAQFHPESRLSA